MSRSDSKSLLEEFPELAVWFDMEANGFTADKITSKNPKKVAWKCEKGHTFSRSVADVVRRGFICNYCTGRLASPENNLRVHYPDIADMFDKGNNGKLAAEMTTQSGGKNKAEWVCENDHVFMKSIAETVRTKGICRECNSLAFKFPHLRKEYSLNNTIAFDSLSYGANKKVLWVCAEGHEWATTVSHRTTRGLGCSYCSGRFATEENNLSAARPDLLKYFDAEKTGADASTFTPHSNRDAWWKCDAGHSYKTSPAKKNRPDYPYGCPFCSGYQVNESNSLAGLHPALAEEFMSTKNGVDPTTIPCGRSDSYWWKCKAKGHEWKASVADRVSRGSGCSYCSGRFATSEINLLVARPEDAAHFNVTRNGVTPDKISPKSNKYYWWKCDNGHDWRATAAGKKGCPNCTMNQVSKVERVLRSALHTAGIATTAEDNHKLDIKWRKNKTMSVDVICQMGDINMVVEYDGYYYHSGAASKDPKSVIQRDLDKTQALIDAGYKVVRVREESFAGRLDFLDISHPDLLQISYRYEIGSPSNTFDGTVKTIREWVDKS